MWFPPVPYPYRDEWLGSRLLQQRHRTRRRRRQVRYGDDTDIGSGESGNIAHQMGPFDGKGAANSSFVMANLLLYRSSSTARATSSVASPASSPSSSSTARRSLLSAARPSTSLASSSAPSVRYTFTLLYETDKHDCEDRHTWEDMGIGHSKRRTAWEMAVREETNIEDRTTRTVKLTRIRDYSQVPLVPAQDDPVQPHSRW